MTNQPSSSSGSGHIVVVGSINMDLVVRAPHLPQPGETIIGSDFKTFPGGKGANQAVAAARLGGRVKMIGRVGDDAFGAQLLQTLRDDCIDTTFVQRDAAAPSGVALITVEDAGQNTIVVASGANARVTPADVDAAAAAFEGASVLLLQLECPLPTVRHAIEVARQRQVRVILNPAPSQPLDALLLSQVDYLVPNQIELALLTQTDSLEEGVSQLKGAGYQASRRHLGRGRRRGLRRRSGFSAPPASRQRGGHDGGRRRLCGRFCRRARRGQVDARRRRVGQRRGRARRDPCRRAALTANTRRTARIPQASFTLTWRANMASSSTAPA